MKVSTYLMSELLSRGITRVFGVPGRENAHILFNEVAGIEFVTTRVEFNAGIMAEFAGRMTQKPQAAFCTMGPGATNMATAAASAMLNRSPLLIISAQLESDDRFYNVTHQCVDQRKVFEPITKWSHELESADELPGVIEQAFSHMMTEPMGPVHLSIPTDLFGKTVNAAINPLDAPVRHPKPQWVKTEVDESVIAGLYEALAQSKKPLCLVGHEAIRAGAEEEIQQFCRDWNMPLLAAANAKGILPNDDPLNVGSASCYMEGILQYPTALAELFDNVDLIVNIGYQYVDDILPKMWTRGQLKKVLHISAFTAAPIKTKYAPDLEAVGNIRTTLAALLKKEAIKKPTPQLGRLRDKMDTVYSIRSKNRPTMTPVEVIRVINENLEDGTFVTDIGYYRHHAILFSKPSRTKQFFTDSGLSTFGCGLPSAASAQFLNRNKPVFLLCGDGGFHSGSCDLETLVRHELPVVIIVLNNSAFELIQRYQQRGGQGNNAEILAFGQVDFAKLADANGMPSARVSNVAELESVVRQRDRTRPLLVEVPLAYHEGDKFIESF